MIIFVFPRNKMETEIRRCSDPHHSSKISGHARDKVPISLFRKDPDDLTSQLFKSCSNCRISCRVNGKVKTARNIALHEESKKRNDGYLHCVYADHDNCSSIPRNRVPIEMFRRIADNPKSSLLRCCAACRRIRTNCNQNRLKAKKVEALEVGRFFCVSCKTSYTLDQRALNINGTFSTLCFKCKDKERLRHVSNRDSFKDLKMEHLLAMQASCYQCKSIFIRDIDDERIIIELKTVETDEGRVAIFDDEPFLAKDIIQSGSEILELDILQFDHLPEDEQRARGLLREDEAYVPKVRNVSNMSSAGAMKLEALKCQLVCAKCHLKETMRREKGYDMALASHAEREKREYVDDIKRKGCEICLYVNVDLLRFFQLDHLKPNEKFDNIGSIVKNCKRTLDDLKYEVEKCRVLCIHCHIIHTRTQRLNGEIKDGVRDVY
jgi:hypothetical protein